MAEKTVLTSLQLGTRLNDPDIADFPRMVKNLSPAAVRRYFRGLARDLGKEILR